MASNKKRVVIPNVIGEGGRKLLLARDDIEVVPFPATIASGDFHALLKSGDVDAAILGVMRFGEAECALARGLQVVARIGVGYDAIDVGALTRRRIPLMLVGTANSSSVAEHALFLMLALARRCLAMEMNVLVYDPYLPAEHMRAAGCEPVSDLDAALPGADFVTIHCPKTPETIGMFGAARLPRMKKTAYLVNTARGGIVDESALHAVLTERTIAGAGIDVLEQEPPAPDHPLLRQPNVIFSPHMAGVTRESIDRMAAQAAKNALSVLDGNPIRENVVNPEVFD